MKSSALSELLMAKTYEQCFWVMRKLPLHGGFIAMQHIVDLNYSNLINFDEDAFIWPGPGCMDGLSKCFGVRLKATNASDVKRATDILRHFVDNQEQHFKHIGEKPVTLRDRRLKLVDLQNCACELDKLARVKFPKYNLERSKMKRGYDAAKAQPLMALMLPPKW
jgi:hypothetical protein